MKIHFNRTKIIATTGPSTSTYKTMLKMVEAGVDVFRLNFSHGKYEDHQKIIDNINKINKEYNTNIGVLADLQGPKIRVGEVKDNKVKLVEGNQVILTTNKAIGTAEKLYINYDKLPQDVKKGESILLDDGKIELTVVDSNRKDKITANIKYGGLLSSNKGVNLPNSNISIPCLTKKDLRDLKFALKNNANWIALSFVRSADDIIELKKIIARHNKETKIIAKIEKPEAVEQIDAIIEETDAIMIARGDLGVEVPIYRMPVIQKHIVEKCIENACPAIIATQIMESMIKNPNPTRAEVTDVANAVFDGADAVMLSGETSVGKHPVKVISMIERIIEDIEKEDDIYNKRLKPNPASESFLSDAVCYNACRISEQVKAKAIIGMTRSGYTAFVTSSYRPHAKVYVFTDNRDLLNTMSLTWGVRAIYYNKMISTDGTIKDVKDILKEEGFVNEGDIVINLASMPLHEQGQTNMLKISVIK